MSPHVCGQHSSTHRQDVDVSPPPMNILDLMRKFNMPTGNQTEQSLGEIFLGMVFSLEFSIYEMIMNCDRRSD